MCVCVCLRLLSAAVLLRVYVVVVVFVGGDGESIGYTMLRSRGGYFVAPGECVSCIEEYLETRLMINNIYF